VIHILGAFGNYCCQSAVEIVVQLASTVTLHILSRISRLLWFGRDIIAWESRSCSKGIWLIFLCIFFPFEILVRQLFFLTFFTRTGNPNRLSLKLIKQKFLKFIPFKSWKQFLDVLIVPNIKRRIESDYIYHLLLFTDKILKLRDVIAICNQYAWIIIVSSHYSLEISHRFIRDKTDIIKSIAKLDLYMIVIRLFVKKKHFLWFLVADTDC